MLKETAMTESQNGDAIIQPNVQLLWKENVSLSYKGPILHHIDRTKLLAQHRDVNIIYKESELCVNGNWDSISQFRQSFMAETKQVLAKMLSNNAPAPQEATTKAPPHEAPVGIIHMSSLSSDVLALMKKCDVFPNDHLTYDIENGGITIECPGDHKTATTIAEVFQTEYQQLMMGRKLREHSFPVPSAYDMEQIQKLVNKNNSEFAQSIFKFDQVNNNIKCLSMSARQMSLIKAKFTKQSSTTSRTTSQDTSTSISFMTVQGRQITLKQADIVEEAVDAIVNAANENLIHGAGVAKAINKASNGMVQQQSTALMQKRGVLEVGQAVHTRAGGTLKCKYVIHTVGPELSKHGGQCKNLLGVACMSAMQEAEKLKVVSLALPPISTGIFAVPITMAAKTIIDAVCTYTCNHDGILSDVRIVIIDSKTYEAFKPFFLDAKSTTEGDAIITQPKPSAPPHTAPITYQRSRSWSNNEASSDDKCSICREDYKKKFTTTCNHSYCSNCIEEALQYSPYCPLCNTPLRKITGNQPDGTIATQLLKSTELPGYENYSTIRITYQIPDGIQQKGHPNPGKPFSGTTRHAYLPDSTEGREVLQKLKKAFEAKLIFTVGTSATNGETDTVVWNDIHHKTRMHGGPSKFGYPDSGYLQRVTQELNQKGIK